MTAGTATFSTALLRRAAHDIRGAAAIAGLTLDEIEAITGEEVPPGQHDLVERGRRALRKLARVAERMTRASILLSGGPTLNRERLDVPKMVRACAAQATSIEARADISIDVELLAPARIEADAAWLGAAVSDTIGLAIQRARRQVRISGCSDGNEPLLIIEHDGLRAEAEPDPLADLPLTMADAVLRAHGGSLTIDPPAVLDGLIHGGRFVMTLGGA